METNIRQRGDVGGSAKKVGKRLDELKRIYGVQNGNNQHSLPNKSEPSITQKRLASMHEMSVDTMENYIMLSKMIPELEELIDTGIVTKTTALAMIKNLSIEEQKEIISTLPSDKKMLNFVKEMSQYDYMAESFNRIIRLTNSVSRGEPCNFDLNRFNYLLYRGLLQSRNLRKGYKSKQRLLKEQGQT